MSLAGIVSWVWIDCFTRMPLTGDDAKRLKANGFHLCLVSPELQGRTDAQEIHNMRDLLQQDDISLDAVCTKRGELWT